jgi:hypothetical protein
LFDAIVRAQAATLADHFLAGAPKITPDTELAANDPTRPFATTIQENPAL